MAGASRPDGLFKTGRRMMPAAVAVGPWELAVMFVINTVALGLVSKFAHGGL